jgi:hypothetical protein
LAVVFLASPAMSAGFRTRWSSPSSGLQLLTILLIHRGLWAASKIPISLWERSQCSSRFFEMTDRLSLRPAGLLARNNFRLGRHPFAIGGKFQMGLPTSNKRTSAALGGRFHLSSERIYQTVAL